MIKQWKQEQEMRNENAWRNIYRANGQTFLHLPPMTIKKRKEKWVNIFLNNTKMPGKVLAVCTFDLVENRVSTIQPAKLRGKIHKAKNKTSFVVTSWSITVESEKIKGRNNTLQRIKTWKLAPTKHPGMKTCRFLAIRLTTTGNKKHYNPKHMRDGTEVTCNICIDDLQKNTENKKRM